LKVFKTQQKEPPSQKRCWQRVNQRRHLGIEQKEEAKANLKVGERRVSRENRIRHRIKLRRKKAKAKKAEAISTAKLSVM